MGYGIDISLLSKKRGDLFSWDPNLFPGARAKLVDHGTSVLLFTSGNGVITGAKCEEDIVSMSA